jgi:hypothetical protein
MLHGLEAGAIPQVKLIRSLLPPLRRASQPSQPFPISAPGDNPQFMGHGAFILNNIE